MPNHKPVTDEELAEQADAYAKAFVKNLNKREDQADGAEEDDEGAEE